MKIFKDEISQLSSDVLDLFKWKITIISSFTGLGLGWNFQNSGQDTGLYIVSVIGFLCAYIDCVYYKKTITILGIAKYIREYSGSDKEMKELKVYEETMDAYRSRGLFFISDRWAQFFASLFFSIGIPLIGMFQINQFPVAPMIISSLAVIIIIYLFIYYSLRRKKMRDRKCE